MPGTAHCAFLLQQYRGEGFCCRYRRRTRRTRPRRHRQNLQRKEHKPECRTQARQADTKELPGCKSRIYPYAGCLYSSKPTEIANDAKADLFISIHTNALANNRTAKGASTWTLGLAKSDANLEVAKRENSVILYESDYKTRYAGFNPNSAESYIIFEFMQDKYMSQSVHLASLVQKHFRNTCRRVDRGVHQAGFLVLKASAMPSILVELGFISTPEEERYLNTDAGTGTLADGIFRAFLTYKREQEIRLNGSSQTILPEDLPQPEEKTSAPADATPETEKKATARNNKPAPQPSEKATVAQTEDKAPVFKIQILTSSRPLAKNDKRLKGLKDVDYYKEGGLYKYTYGASSDYNKVLRTKRSITAKFKDAFIIAFKNGRKVNVNTAIREFKTKEINKIHHEVYYQRSQNWNRRHSSALHISIWYQLSERHSHVQAFQLFLCQVP